MEQPFGTISASHAMVNAEQRARDLDVLKELWREMESRRRRYPRQVADGNMTKAAAEHRLACLARAVALLEAAFNRDGYLAL